MAEWISVKDRLPEKFEVCIVCGKKGSVHIRSYAKEYGFFDTYRGLDGDTHIGNEHMEKNLITHWMPLPEPPKGETDD